MKRCFLGLGITLIFAGVPGMSQTVQPPASVSLTATSTTNPPYKVGQPIVVSVTMTNTAKTPLYWALATPDPGYVNFLFSLKREGVAVPKTAFHRKIRGEQTADDPPDTLSGKIMPQMIPPGGSYKFDLDLSKLYTLTQAGTYTLIVERRDHANTLDVFSPPIQVTVEP